MVSTFVKKIIFLRKKQNLSQSALARKSNIAQTTLSDWERGIGVPNINHAEILAKSLNTNLIDILSNDDMEEVNIELKYPKKIKGRGKIE